MFPNIVCVLTNILEHYLANVCHESHVIYKLLQKVYLITTTSCQQARLSGYQVLDSRRMERMARNTRRTQTEGNTWTWTLPGTQEWSSDKQSPKSYSIPFARLSMASGLSGALSPSWRALKSAPKVLYFYFICDAYTHISY